MLLHFKVLVKKLEKEIADVAIQSGSVFYTSNLHKT